MSGFGRIMTAVIVSTMLALIPVGLLGSLVVLLRADLAFDEQGLGLASATFFASAAVTSVLGGRVAERLGSRAAILLGGTSTVICLLGIAAVVHSWAALVAFLCLGGAAMGIAQQGSNAALARDVPAHRQGMAFGTKQSAVTLTALLAGLAVPMLGLTIGWRWTYTAMALLIVPVFVLVPTQPAPGRRSTRGLRDGDPALFVLCVVSLAGAMAGGVASVVPTFLVASAVDAGIATATAGLMLTIGGLAGSASRILVGWSADRRSGRHFDICAALIGGGAVGFFILAGAGTPLVFALGSALVFGVGWSWSGLFLFALVRTNQNAPAAATGVGQAGAFVGAVVGPIAFGTAVVRVGYQSAWLGVAFLAVLAAVTMLLGGRMMQRHANRPMAT